MTDATLSVGLPSFSASTQVPASFFSFSSPGWAGEAALAASSARAPAARARTIRPAVNIRRVIARLQNEGKGPTAPHRTGPELFTPSAHRPGDHDHPADPKPVGDHSVA